jgi:hypothetical protein
VWIGRTIALWGFNAVQQFDAADSVASILAATMAVMCISQLS